jgi:hypothetical protein
MMKAIILSCVALAIVQQISAQEKSNKVKFTSTQQLGLYYNGLTSNPELGISAGVHYKRFDYMLGGNLLVSPIASNALFLDVRYYTGKAQKFYVGSNTGVAMMAKKQSLTYIDNRTWFVRDWQNWNGLDEITKMPGVFAQGLIGYKATLGKEVSYNVSLAYGLHQLRYSENYAMPGDVPATATISYNQWRYGLRMGLSF